MSNHYLITGGAGFIGSNLVDALLAKHCKVIVLDNFNDYYSKTLKKANLSQAKKNPNFTLIEGDIRDESILETVFNKYSIDAVIHLAARAGVRPSLENPRLYYDVNIMGTLNILEAMRMHKISNLVFASSSSVYGDLSVGPFVETQNTDMAVSPYGASKKSAEVLCHSYSHLYNMSIKCLRFFTAYGPRNRPDMACYLFTDAIVKGNPLTQFGDGSSGRDYTYIDDIVTGIISASKIDKKFEIFNLGNSSPVLLSELISTIEKVVGKQAKVNIKPMQPGDVTLTYADVSKAKKILSFEPKTDLLTGLTNLYAWYQALPR